MDSEKSPIKPKKTSLGYLLTDKVNKTPTFVSPVLQQVGKLAASVASVGAELTASGSATGNFRNKCALQPGHSLMDWIRLGASGKDLTGLGSQAGRIQVTKHELAKHNKIDDIWLAIRGWVYNVTEYVPFHPGGPEELMRAAGIDATSLFDQVHPWVNYEQILQKCIIGKLVNIDPRVDKEKLFFGSPTSNKDSNSQKLEILENTTNTGTQEKIETPSQSSPLIKNEEKEKLEEATLPQENKEDSISLPRFDWIQKLQFITTIFYTESFSNPLVEVYPPVSQKAIVVCICYGGKVYRNELTFQNDVQWPCTIKMTWETGKVEVIFKKVVAKVWDNYGSLQQSSTVVNKNAVKINYTVKNKIQINHNIYLLELERNDGCRLVVPIGRHIRVFTEVDGREKSRSYTPVPSSLFKSITSNDYAPNEICLMIKRYKQGTVSRPITGCEPGDVFQISKPMGDFELKRIEKREVFLLLAAGTGITPMFSLLLFLLERRIKKCQFARLLFFNRTKDDIPFKTQFDALQDGDSRLRVDHVLSEPDLDWKGLTGHVNKELICNAIQEHIKDTGYTINDVFVFICGPNQFVCLALDELQSLDISNEQIHVFSG